jgi:hypothetical protein
MAEPKDACVTPAKGPIISPEPKTAVQIQNQGGGIKMIAQVGKPAPDFEAWPESGG